MLVIMVKIQEIMMNLCLFFEFRKIKETTLKFSQESVTVL